MNPSPNILIAIAALLLSLRAASAQGTFTVTFDGPPVLPPGTARLEQYYDESGVWFTPIPGSMYGFGHRGSNPTPGWPDNGTAYVQAGLGSTLMFGRDDGSDFGLDSVDLAEYSTVVPDAVTVPFVGYRRDGSTVTTYFTTDGIIDGTGPLADFETLHFPKEFSGVYQVRIPAYGWSLDNLRIFVPEPGTGALLAVAGAFFGLCLLRRRGRSPRKGVS